MHPSIRRSMVEWRGGRNLMGCPLRLDSLFQNDHSSSYGIGRRTGLGITKVLNMVFGDVPINGALHARDSDMHGDRERECYRERHQVRDGLRSPSETNTCHNQMLMVEQWRPVDDHPRKLCPYGTQGPQKQRATRNSELTPEIQN